MSGHDHEQGFRQRNLRYGYPRRIGRFRRGENHHSRGSEHVLRGLPFIVKKSLERVPGVANVMVCFKDKTAVVIYDDSKADVTALTAATTNAGYPSAPKG